MADDPAPGPYRKNAFVEPAPAPEPAPLVEAQLPGFWTRRARHRAASAVLVGLPMRCEHQPPEAIWSRRGRPIVEVRIRMRGPIRRFEVERACAEVRRAAPGLGSAIDGSDIVLTRWPWYHDDRVLLAHLLSSWGTALHQQYGIDIIGVTWWDGYPRPGYGA